MSPNISVEDDEVLVNQPIRGNGRTRGSDRGNARGSQANRGNQGGRGGGNSGNRGTRGNRGNRGNRGVRGSRGNHNVRGAGRGAGGEEEEEALPEALMIVPVEIEEGEPSRRRGLRRLRPESASDDVEEPQQRRPRR